MNRKSMVVRAFVCLGALLLVSALFAQSGQGYLKAKVNPGRTGVFVDGKYLGPAANFRFARKYAVAPGEHELRLVEPRYQDHVTRITVEAGKTTTISHKMTPLPPAQPPFGMIRTAYPDKFAAVFLNGKFYGHAGEYNNPVQGLKIPPGEYKVTLVPTDGSAEREETVRVEADKTTVVRFAK